MSEIENKPTKVKLPTEGAENTRRKFLKGAVAVSPVLLTVVNRPVWAANCSLSGELSGNLSQQASGVTCGDEGCSVRYWREHQFTSMSAMNQGSWHPSYGPDMLFNEAFGRPVFRNKTLSDIIDFKQGMTKSEIFDGMTIDVNSTMNAALDPTNHDPAHQQKHSPEMMLLRLAAQSVAALENAATSVRYKYTVLGLDLDPDRESVIRKFQAAWDSGNYQTWKTLKQDFRTENKRSCPF
ncbi:MAG: hypothetical protein ACC707_03605 [Thiohalomonadales bacterium]